MNQPTLYVSIAYALWGVLGLVWIVFTFATKSTVQKEGMPGRLAVLVLLIVGYAIIFSGNIPFFIVGYRFDVTAVIGWLGVFITACGVVLAIWARLIIGRNWSGSSITLKENHELAQTGAYRIVRHPIYTGLLVATIGLILTKGAPFDIVGVTLIAAAFLIRIPKEEKLMIQQFPTEYPKYMHKTKALVPFIW